MSRNDLTTKKSKKVRKSSWKYENTEPVELCKGARIDPMVYEISENRYYTLVIKGFIVYLITAGGLGAYLTAFDVEFNQLIFNAVIFVTAIICAALYHSWKSENLGYLVFFAFYAAIMVLFKDYINSGFYAVVNDTIDWASIYFDTEGLQYYNERIANREAAITISMSVIGVAMNVLLNNYILRRARYMVAIFLGVTINVVAFYMQREPDTLYTMMLLSGIVMTFVLKCGRHFLLSRRDHVFERSKKGLTYALDYRSLWQGFAAVLIFCIGTIAVMNTVYDKVYYDIEQEPSEAKQITQDTFQNFIMMGIFGILDYYPNTGGLATGALGGVSSIRLDYMPDLSLIYTPYTTDMVYIKNFEGMHYLAYENKWVNDKSDKQQSYRSEYSIEMRALKKAYEDGNEGSAKGLMTITNVEAPLLGYQPYYTPSDKTPIMPRQTKNYIYYPRLDKTDAIVDDYTPEDGYLEVPEENKKIIDEFIKDNNIGGSTPQEIAASIEDYFQENVPYTVRPGATPWRQDFINYFLTKNKKGYCAHFASAGTLILRELGIPARYCEGYAVSFTQALERGELVEGAEYSDYYDGYNELGETAPVRVSATDADAHAWIEMFVKGEGWIVVELTPSGGLDEEEDDNFWEAFNNIFGDADEDNVEREPTDTNAFELSGIDAFMKKAAKVIIALFILAIIGYILYKLYPEVKYVIDVNRAGPSDRLILKYSRFIRKRRKKDAGLRKKMNYSEQMAYLIPGSDADRERMTDILERAGFSKGDISASDYEFAEGILKSLSPKLEK